MGQDVLTGGMGYFQSMAQRVWPFLPSEREAILGGAGEKETDKHALSKYCQEEPKRTTVCRCSFCVISFDPQSSPMGIHPVYDEETETQRHEEMCPGFHS